LRACPPKRAQREGGTTIPLGPRSLAGSGDLPGGVRLRRSVGGTRRSPGEGGRTGRPDRATLFGLAP
jgi:hypothetical protein